MSGIQPKENRLFHPLKGYLSVIVALIEQITSSAPTFQSVGFDVTHETFRRKLKLVVERSLAYADSVDDLQWFGRTQDRTKRIREKVLSGDFGELNDLIKQLNKFLLRSRESYQAVNEAFADVLSTANNAAQTARENEQRERRRRNITRLTGGAASAALLVTAVGTGVTLSVVAGVLTFGVGTIVGLSLTVAGVGVVGTGAAAGVGVATHVGASHFAESENKFARLTQTLDEVLSSLSRMDASIGSLKVQVVALSANLENVCETKEFHEERLSLVSALDRLFERFDECDNEQISALRQKIETKCLDFLP